MSKGNPLVVAALDFGTTYSGWAFSFKHEYEMEPTKVTAKRWYGPESAVSLKAPTSILIKPDGETFHSFGFVAETEYALLAEENQHMDYFFFQRFKMQLYDKMSLGQTFEIQDVTGKSLSANVVFSLSIKYLKDDLIETLKAGLLDKVIPESDIQWVLTVPAIWNDAAKQFMRSAAENAGIAGENLTIALEPEVASLYCQHIRGVDSLAMMKAGSKYLILDAGGGTVDITVHEISSDDSLKEIYKASGGDWGGTKVDQAFENFLIEITGTDVVKQFKESAMGDYLDLMKSFELKKRSKLPGQSIQKVMLKIPTKLKTLTEEIIGKVPEDTIAESRYKGGIKIVNDKLRFDIGIMNSFFEESLDNIVGHLKELFMKPDVDACDVILMVGGYSESYHLQEKIKSNFPSKEVVIPNEAGLAVLTGAVMFGHNPALIAERKMKFTYGNDAFPGLFVIHVREGDTVKLGEQLPEQTFHPVLPFQTAANVNLYCTKDRDPTFVYEENCIKLGTVNVPMPDTTGGWDREVGVSFLFGGTEIEVKVRNKGEGTEQKIMISYC